MYVNILDTFFSEFIGQNIGQQIKNPENRQWHTGRCSGGLVVGLHGEEVAEPGLLAKGEPDEVAPDLVAHLVVIVNNSRFVESSCSPR